MSKKPNQPATTPPPKPPPPPPVLLTAHLLGHIRPDAPQWEIVWYAEIGPGDVCVILDDVTVARKIRAAKEQQ